MEGGREEGEGGGRRGRKGMSSVIATRQLPSIQNKP